MGKKKRKPSRMNKTNKKKENPQNQNLINGEAYYGPQTYEKYTFFAVFIGSIVFLFIYLGGLVMFLIG